MSVDKFGRYTEFGVRSRSNDKEAHTGFPVTPEGDYNVSNKRLKYVNDPQDDSDAINLKTLTSEMTTYSNYIVRVLSEMFFDFYNKLAKSKIKESQKNEWIKTNIVNKYFLNPKTKIYRKAE